MHEKYGIASHCSVHSHRSLCQFVTVQRIDVDVGQRYIKSRDLNPIFIIDIFSPYDRRIGQSGADR